MCAIFYNNSVLYSDRFGHFYRKYTVFLEITCRVNGEVESFYGTSVKFKKNTKIIVLGYTTN